MRTSNNFLGHLCLHRREMNMVVSGDYADSKLWAECS